MPSRPAPLRLAQRFLRVLGMAAGLWVNPIAAQPATPAATIPSTVPANPTPLSDLVAQAQAQLAQGNAQAAHALLASNLRWYAGDPEFDYLLGLAAFDSGQPGRAVLAFERVLLVRPAHLQARAELARALLASGETEAARQTFETVASQPIPPEVQVIIDAYLARIASAEHANRTSFQGRAEIGVGWDSNVTLGSLGDQWLLAGGTAVTPLASSRPRSTALLSWGAGLDWQGPIGGGWQWTIGAQAMGRSNASAHTLDQALFDLTGGLRHRIGCHGFDMLAQLQNLQVDGSSYRNAAGAIAQWRCDLDERTQLGAYVQHYDFRFPEQRVRDARRDIIGLTFVRAFEGRGAPVLIGNVYAGQERPREDVPQLEQRFRGLRTILSTGLAARWRGWVGLSWEARDFAGAEPLFDAIRDDRQTEAEIGVAFELDRSWTLTPRLTHTRNKSTIAPNDFRRTQALVSAQYRF